MQTFKHRATTCLLGPAILVASLFQTASTLPAQETLNEVEMTKSAEERAAAALLQKESYKDQGLPMPPLPFGISSEMENPEITSIAVEGDQIIVTVQVPAGTKVVTLESRNRLERGAWSPRGVQRLDGSVAIEIVFTLTLDSDAEMLRVRADDEAELPMEFFAGDSEFGGQASYYDPSPGEDRFFYPPETAIGDSSGGGAETREVVESDIWKIQGDTLYFFNQFRGLQIIDIADPGQPVLTGTLDLPAVGEQMYVMADGTVVLLARDGCWAGSETTSQIILVSVVEGEPVEIDSLPVRGNILESRMVGTALYVASQSYQQRQAAGDVGVVWEWGTHVSSFDLSGPNAPVARDTLWYSGYGNTVMASQEYLFVSIPSTTSWRGAATVQVIDISGPDGTMLEQSAIRPAGRVTDKFKMDHDGEKEVFTVISEVWSETNRLVTKLENFSLSDPRNPQKLGGVEVGHGESLFATRFDGDRVYIVTFLQIDPLWIVDNSDPEQPVVTGELEIPGWSTYIHPLGDRLVTIGIDNIDGWRAAVQLFDVADPQNPSLLSKVPLGDNYSWTEANYDEKAFSVLPDAGMVLVPFQGHSENGYASQIQIIDLEESSLVERGVIDHTIQSRRATLHDERILSVSGRELIVVDAADRDNPEVTAQLTLSWSVDRVLISDDYLIELSAVNSWQNNYSGVLRVVGMNDPLAVLDSVELGNEWPVIGAEVHGGFLYLLQGKQDGVLWWGVPEEDGTTGGGDVALENSLTLSIFDLDSLPELEMVSSTTFATDTLGWSAGFNALWMANGTLVWTGSGNNYWYGGPIFWDGVAVDGAFAGDIRWGGGGDGGRLLAFDVSQPGAPDLVSDINLTTENSGWWSFSKAYMAGDLIYLSHQGTEFIEGGVIPGQTPPTVVEDTNPDDETDAARPGVWVQKHFLEVVDYADPTEPTVRRPVEVPGSLIGLSHNGRIVYTQGYHWDGEWKTDYREYVDASAYDGVEAHLIDTIALSNLWPHPVLVNNGAVYVGDPMSIDSQTEVVSKPSTLETYVLTSAGNFENTASLILNNPVYSLLSFGDLLVLQDSYQNLLLFDSSGPLNLLEIGSGFPAQCWADLSVADGTLGGGLWIPLHDYGVENIPTNIE